MTARDLLRIVREGWLIILASTILFTTAGAIYTATRTTEYQATSTLAVSACIAVENLPSCDPVGGMTFAVERARIYASAGASAPVLNKALEDTGLASSHKALAPQVEVTHNEDSPLIEVSARWSDPDGAAELANVLSQAIIEYSRESIDTFESDSTTVQFSVISEAIPPTEPVESDSRTVAITFALGVILGVGLATIRWMLDRRLRDREDVESVSGIDVLAVLPTQMPGKRQPKQPDASLTNEYHRLRTIIGSRMVAHEYTTIAVVTPTLPEISSDVSAGLADSFASTRSRVAALLLKNADPAQVHVDISQPEKGAVPHGLLGSVDRANPFTLGYTGTPSDASVAFSTPQFADLMAGVRSSSDVVILDSAPTKAGSEMVAAVRHSDAALIVVRLGVTERDDLLDTLRALDLVGVPVIGIAAVAFH